MGPWSQFGAEAVKKSGMRTQNPDRRHSSGNHCRVQMFAPEALRESFQRWHGAGEEVGWFKPPTVMSLRFNSSPVRFAAIMFIAIFLGLRATAQPDSRDPFVIMRGGAGEQMTASSGDMIRGVTEGLSSDQRDIYFPAYDQARYFDLAQMLFVPPVPPALGDALPSGWNAGFSSSLAPVYARETFYGGYVLLSRLNKLSTKEMERIAAYRSARQQLVDEIRAKFAELAGATPAVRQAGLAELAVRQDSRLRALADEAEAIRSDLAWVNSIFRIRITLPPGPFRLDQSEQSQQLTILGAGKARVAVPELPRLFASAYFHAGLSTEQRLLLTEIAYGQAVGTKKDGQAGRVADTAGFFFLPATACIRLPTGLPPALEEKIHAFAREKESLKSELRSAVLRDDYFFVSTRTRRLAALAEQQAPRFAALEARAEEIRVELAGRGAYDQPEDPALPADLTQRMGSFNARKVEVRRELLNRLRQFQTEYRTYAFNIERKGDGLAIMQVGDWPAADGLAEFNASQARHYTAFAAESEILRRDIQRYLDSSPQRGTRTVDQLAGDFAKAYAAREIRDHYRDYSRAVLEPGLSAAQRRLLFQAAVTELEKTDGSNQP